MCDVRTRSFFPAPRNARAQAEEHLEVVSDAPHGAAVMLEFAADQQTWKQGLIIRGHSHSLSVFTWLVEEGRSRLADLDPGPVGDFVQQADERGLGLVEARAGAAGADLGDSAAKVKHS